MSANRSWVQMLVRQATEAAQYAPLSRQANSGRFDLAGYQAGVKGLMFCLEPGAVLCLEPGIMSCLEPTI